MGIIPYYTAVGGYFEAKVYEYLYEYISKRPETFDLKESAILKNGKFLSGRSESFVSQSDYRFSLFP